MKVVLDASALLPYLIDETGAEVVEGMEVEPFLPVDGDIAGRRREPTPQAGLSLMDRASPSLGMRLGVTLLPWL
jgi:PIN domain nuclease of toxin-antitoxin system